MRYYLEHSNDFNWDEKTGNLENEDDFVIIIDPDVSLLSICITITCSITEVCPLTPVDGNFIPKDASFASPDD